MIDINTLTLHSHVLFNGKRYQVDDISLSGQVGSLPLHDDWLWADASEFDPIPITEELLTELGFEKCHRTPNGFEVAYDYIDKESHTLMEVAKCKNIPEWRVQCVGWTLVRYLHELEAFVYLTTKQRLI